MDREGNLKFHKQEQRVLDDDVGLRDGSSVYLRINTFRLNLAKQKNKSNVY